MGSQEYLELKSILLEQNAMLQMLVPTKASVSYICETTGKKRQTVTAYLKANFEPDVDFWIENGKIMTSKSTTLQLLRKYNER